MPERTLTFNIRDLMDGDVADVECVFSLPAGDRAQPEAGPPAEPARLVMPTPESVWSDQNGDVSIRLLATTDLDLRNPYQLAITGYGGSISFTMPDQDTDLLTILRGANSPLPARQLPDPNALADGEVAISVSNAWVGGRLIFRQTAAPSSPPAGVIALWVDISTAADPVLKVWDGTAWVSAHEVQDGGIINSHLADLSVTTGKLADGAVTEPKLADSAVTTRKIADTAITTNKLGARVVGTGNIAPGAVIEPLIAAGAVGTDRIADQAVTRQKLAPNAIGASHISAGEVGTSELADGSVTEAKLANNAVTTAKIRNVAITNQKIAGATLDNRVMARDAIATDNIQDDAVTQPKIGAGAVGIGELHADASDRLLPTGGTTGQVLKKQSSTDGDADWEAETSGEDAASWAEQGNTDKIPRAKLPAEAFTQYTREHTFTVTVASLGQANEGRGFDRVSGGGGSISGGGQFTLDGQTLTIVAVNQLTTGLVSIYIHGTLPANFQDRYWIIEDASGFHDLLRMRDATRYAREPGDTSYPAGLQAFQEIEWSAQATNIIYTRAVGSTFSLSLAVDPEEYLADQLAAHDVSTAQIEDGAVTHPKLAADAVETDNIADDAVTMPKIADGAVGTDQLANDAVNTINIRDAAVTGSKLDSNSVATANINNLAVTEPKLSADVAARLNPMGGAGGQSDPTSRVQFVSLWKWSGTAPSTSELTGANLPTWGTGGWTDIPSGWTAPAAVSGVGNRYRADTIATWNTTTNSYDLSTWTITEETGFNVEYTDNPDASPLSTTSNRTASSTHWRQRDPNTGHWPVIWNALYSGPENWTVLASVPIGVTSKTMERIVTFTNPIRTRDIRFLAVQIDVRNPGLNQTDISGSYILQPWNQLWPAPATDTTNNYISGASFVAFCGPAEIEVISSQGTLPGNISAGASNYFGAKWKFRGDTASGQLQSVRFHEWAATGQSGYITFLTR